GAYGQPDSTWGAGKLARRLFLGSYGQVDSIRIGGYSGQSAANQHVTRYTHDGRGRVLQLSDTYNGSAHVLSTTEYASGTGNRSRVVSGDRVDTLLYDSYGRDTLLISSSLAAPVRKYYSAINQLRALVHRGIDSTEYTYDSLNLIQIRDPKGLVYQ